MTVLLTVYDSDGVVGKCDARCYNAKGDTCTCICDGRNHGIGKEKAILNSQEIALDIEGEVLVVLNEE